MMAVPPERLLAALRRLGLLTDDIAQAAGLVDALQSRQVEPGEPMPLEELLAMAEITEADIDAAVADWDRWAAEHAPDLVGLLGAEQVD